ncbi:MAG TPA: hypothetical protein VFL78_11070, partial [Rhodanobacteraceae bacterium]|nr:hypothetical protein [Rhodanobacteraceae bacterium]
AMGKYATATKAAAATAAAMTAFAVAETAETSTVPAGAMHGFVHVLEKGAVVAVPERVIVHVHDVSPIQSQDAI